MAGFVGSFNVFVLATCCCISHDCFSVLANSFPAVVDALKTLQEKIRRLELERKQAEKSFQQFSHDVQKHNALDQDLIRILDSKLQSAEARCKVLEKQLDYMRKMVENAKKERNTLMENQVVEQEKLEKLESECHKLSRTQALAEMKLAILEQKLLKEEHERKLVQDKADELQREFENNLQLTMPPTEEIKPKKGKKMSMVGSLKTNSPRHTKMPFVAGTSISPSHSVHANVQSILHMMKHHQPQLCERMSALHRPGAKKNLQKEFPPFSSASKKSDSLPEQVDQSLSSLSDLLLALQDELGQMSFEHQELVHQIDAATDRHKKEDLQQELERLVARMEEKGVQITKLRKHQQTVSESSCSKKLSGTKPPVPSLLKAKQKGKKTMTAHSNLQLLQETKKFRNSLKQDDLSWET
uniref:Centrosomal protein 57kDa-like protein 1 n=1 Tax=Echeneis naucrates TaxID=173247 RepID=A0A665X0F3_ECHNA